MLHGQAKGMTAPSWDQAAQQYLALAALSQARHDLGEPADEALREFLKEFFERLTFPPGYDSPRGFAPQPQR
jgi:predicted AAA+ superfamily ATPase